MHRYYRLAPLVALGILLIGAMSVLAGAPAPARPAPVVAARPAQGTSTPTVTATATPVPPCGLAWRVVSSPNPPASYGLVLNGVFARTTSDVWAVGSYYNASNQERTLIEHWDGGQWLIVSSPNPRPNDDNRLAGVVALAPDDAWAVGYSLFNGSLAPFILHWDGATWTVSTTPNPGGSDSALFGVAAVAPNDVWAVGYSNGSNERLPLAEHWNGSAWTIVNTATVGAGSLLRGVAARAANDVWAVGLGSTGSLIEHWNGSVWTTVPAPAIGYPNELYSVVSLTATDAWSVGYYHSSAYYTTTMHWNGSQWALVPSLDPDPSYNALYGITAVNANDLWAVGSDDDSTLIEHWTGAQWSLADGGQGYLQGVSALAATDVWAVGASTQTLTKHYSDPCVTASPTATSTATRTSTPTVTGTPPTASPTTTACSLQFSDVPLSDPFYPYIHCLACRNIVSGYSTNPPCGAGIPCFQPGASVTRGQLAKFIANAAGYQDPIPSTQQTFTDVPYGSPFWLYVERAALHGVISGYNSNPPCIGGVPCFLPGNNVTRSQTAKFVANAAGYQDPVPSGQQTFSDVPPGDPFWVYVERAGPAGHAIISGYTCGQPPAGSCDPLQRPWFLGGNAVTRGQTAKFIANAFFPNCQTPAR